MYFRENYPFYKVTNFTTYYNLSIFYGGQLIALCQDHEYVLTVKVSIGEAKTPLLNHKVNALCNIERMCAFCVPSEQFRSLNRILQFST